MSVYENNNVGQIVYNLQDYRNRYNYMSTSSSSMLDLVFSDSLKYNADCYRDPYAGATASDGQKIYIYENIIGRDSPFQIEQVSKLGVLAPPGTRFVINNEKNIMMGRTGVYELDEGIAVTSLRFIRPRKYVLNELETENTLNSGMEQLKTAKQNFEDAVAAITAELNTPDYWKEYNDCYAAYRREYQSAYALFLQGVNGIYKNPNENDPDADENFDELENIIVDFLY